MLKKHHEILLGCFVVLFALLILNFVRARISLTLLLTRSSKMNVAPLFKHSSSADHQDQWIAEFSRSKDLDATAIPPIPPVFILINSSLEVVWMSSE